VAGTLWALDAGLAHQRHFPAVDWATSYSLHAAELAPCFGELAGPDWGTLRQEALALLQEGRDLREIAALVGPDALQDHDRLVLEAARLIQDLVLAQSAFDPNDACSPVRKTYLLASLALQTYRDGRAALEAGVGFEALALDPVRRSLAELVGAPDAALETLAAEAANVIGRLAVREGGRTP
jgi:V/A-type H+-transporting ATPase subunit A